MTKEQEDTWLAGLFDGEGCFNITFDKQGYLDIRAKITQGKCDAFLERIREVMGIGYVEPGHRWSCPRGKTLQFLNRVEPYLIVKANEARIVRALIGTYGEKDLTERGELLNQWALTKPSRAHFATNVPSKTLPV